MRTLLTWWHRLSFPVPGRLPRIVQEPGITSHGIFIPAGVSASEANTKTPSYWRSSTVRSLILNVSKSHKREVLPKPHQILTRTMARPSRIKNTGQGVCPVQSWSTIMCWYQVSCLSSTARLLWFLSYTCHSREDFNTTFQKLGNWRCGSLAYCELYVTIGTLFRKFPDLKGNDLSAEDTVYNDYFSAQNPVDAKKFHVVPPAS